MYNILIVDDEAEQCEALKIILERRKENIVADICTTLEKAKIFCAGKKYDVFLLDMKLDEKDGDEGELQLGNYIRSIIPYKYTPIIYITSVPEKIQAALSDTGCFRYILKPYTAENINKCLDDVLHSPLVAPETFSFQNFWGGEIRIPERLIIYICPGINRRVQIYTKDGCYETISYTMEQVENILRYGFFRCHRKYIVNLKCISEYDRSNRLLYIGDTEIPVGRKYKEAFENIWRVL